MSDIYSSELKKMSKQNLYQDRDAIYNEKYNHAVVNFVDADTGADVKIDSIIDVTRLSRNGDNDNEINEYNGFSETVTHHSKTRMEREILGQFLKTSNSSQTNLNSYSVIKNLGKHVTNEMIEKITKNANSDLGEIDDQNVLNALDFTGYEYPEGTNSDGSRNSGNMRATASMGLALGDATTMNPLHQFNKRDDVRTSPLYASIGRVYLETILTRSPIVLVQPGRLKYHTGFFKLMGIGGSAGATEALLRTGGEGLGGALSNMWVSATDAFSVLGTLGGALLGGNKVVEFKQNYNLFKMFARNLYIHLATNMGLMHNQNYVGRYSELSLDNILPGKNLYDKDSALRFKSNQYIGFRCGKGIISTESFSNGMTTNPLMSSMNSTSEELDEASGDASTKVGQSLLNDGLAAAGNVFMKKLLTKGAGAFSEQALVLSGKARVSIPDVWSTSSFSRSFGFNFKFHSPLGDDLSVFENCYLPFLTWLAMALPRQTGKMSYTSPFAIRLSVKNMIMINFGMVESLTVTRGGDINDWTPNGYPKTLSVDISIKDMEPNISLPLGSRGPARAALEQMFPSSGISEYLASLGGLSIRDYTSMGPRFKRATTTFTSTWNAKMDWDNVMSTLTNSSVVSNVISSFVVTDMDTAYDSNKDVNEYISTSGVTPRNLGAPYNLSVIENNGMNTSVLEEQAAAEMANAQEIISGISG